MYTQVTYTIPEWSIGLMSFLFVYVFCLLILDISELFDKGD